MATDVAVQQPGGANDAARWRIDPRYLPPMLISLILVVGNLTLRGLEGWDRTALAIVTALVTEVVLGKLIHGKVPHLASAYISGISVGILLRSPYFWPFAVCSAIAIASKYALRANGRHIWNPSNFAIAMMVLLAHEAVATLSIQWGNDARVMVIIWVVGAMIIGRLRRFHISLTYVVSFVLYAFIRSVITGDMFLAEVAPLTGPMYQLFTFFMITDPPTTVKGVRPQMLVAFLVATVEFLIRLSGMLDLGPLLEVIAIHAPYFALFTVGPLALLAQGWWVRREAAHHPGRRMLQGR